MCRFQSVHCIQTATNFLLQCKASLGQLYLQSPQLAETGHKLQTSPFINSYQSTTVMRGYEITSI